MKFIVDSHAHLYDGKFSEDLPQVLERAVKAGVQQIIVPGDSIITSRKSVRLAQRYSEIFSAVGVHPHEAINCSDSSLKEISELTGEKKVVAIGEIGLDYYYDFSPRDVQREVFRKQLLFASERRLPVIMHCREAYPDFVDILMEFRTQNLKGVCHCFSGNLDDAKAILEPGFFISFAGTVTFPKAESLRSVASEIPLERMLLETDSPYLAPQPLRGKRNEPAFIVHNVEEISRLHGTTIEELVEITTRNAQNLFQLPEQASSPVLTYELGNNLYINVTNRCTNRCVFCRRLTRPVIAGMNLALLREPTSQEIIEHIHNPSGYDEVVFCGFGEPLIRLDVVKDVARYLRENGARKIRINTNGQANLFHGRNILPELAGLVDSFSVSLNACDPGTYQKLCNSEYGIEAFSAVKDFIREAVKLFDDVTVSIVDTGDIVTEKAKLIAVKELGCKFRLRGLLSN